MRSIALAALVFVLATTGASAGVVARIDISKQTMTVVEDGNVLYSWAVSTARSGYRTPRGSYRPIRMHKMWYSHKYHMSPMPYSIFFTGGYAIHGTHAMCAISGGRPRMVACDCIPTTRASSSGWCRSTARKTRGSSSSTEHPAPPGATRGASGNGGGVAELFGFERGAGGTPVVFLHGFGLSHRAWADVLGRIDPARHLIAFDLPGHAGSLGVPHGSAAVAAKSVLAELERRKIARAHLVGHSMGGAVAALVALREPARTASLTLLSPGGFGAEINGSLLRRYAVAIEEAEIAALLPPFFADGHRPPAGLAASIAKERRVAGATDALVAIVETFFDGATQKRLPISDLARLAMPKTILWGEEDQVLPARQAKELPDGFEIHLLEGVGHMLPLEAPDTIARSIAALSS